MKIREKLQLMKQMHEANIKSIDRFLKLNGKDTDSLYAIIRRDGKINSLMCDVVHEYIVEEGKK